MPAACRLAGDARRRRTPGWSPRCSRSSAPGFAYILYFRLIANAGPANAIAVTYLIPLFAVLWGGVFLGERLTPTIVAGCAVIFLGTALATGVVAPRRATPAGDAAKTSARPDAHAAAPTTRRHAATISRCDSTLAKNASRSAGSSGSPRCCSTACPRSRNSRARGDAADASTWWHVR